jgi:transglutaminase-like putative cysteine protease
MDALLFESQGLSLRRRSFIRGAALTGLSAAFGFLPRCTSVAHAANATRMSVRHQTTYTYSKPVWLGPHVFRMLPRSDGMLRLLRQDLRVEPEPLRLSPCLDAECNAVVHAWFEGTTQRLTVVSAFEVELLRENPFDYLLSPLAQKLPIQYADELDSVLGQYVACQDDGEAVAKFAREIAADAGSDTLEFLSLLNRRIYDQFPWTLREEGAAYAPEVTLRLRTGACRDLAVLFIETCRAAGIAARFVSGYQKGDPGRQARRYMHAWAEVYLPGGGWRGYDPTDGTAVADQHVAVAATRDSEAATPIRGSFLGAGVESTMETHVEIH